MGNNDERCQPQVSMSGRTAWVIAKLVKILGKKEADVSRWIIEQWIEGEGRRYLDSYGIDLLDYVQDEAVLALAEASERKSGRGS